MNYSVSPNIYTNYPFVLQFVLLPTGLLHHLMICMVRFTDRHSIDLIVRYL